jgi:hypothetical protein
MWKKVLLTLTMMFVIFFIICAILPSTYRVERTELIQAPDSLIYEQIANFQNWTSWSAWAQRDSLATNSFSGTAATVGQSWDWSGEIVGVGKMEHTALEPLKRVESRLTFMEPQAMVAKSILTMEKTPSGFRVNMIMEGTLGYPVERIFGIIMDDLIGPDFQEGLTNLKTKLESKP